MNTIALSVLVLLSLTMITKVSAEETKWFSPGNSNPILPGYYADPSVIEHQGKHYIYATLDPWGGETLGCWESDDFKNWTYRELNWPTKKACTDATSMGSMVWAPSVFKTKDGKLRMFISVGSEVWVGEADHPLGPWKNTLGNKPLIDKNYNTTYHMIDAEGFVDEDGSAYIYWGSGWNWENGHCFVAKMKTDFTGFDGEVKDVTPENYFEGPYLLKEKGKYYLTYSQGRTDKDTYAVHYAIGDSPFGPFKEASNSPMLVTDKSKDVFSPGHHTFARLDGKIYIVYHRHSLPYQEKRVLRQVCMDEIRFNPDGLIEKVVPTHEGPAAYQRTEDARAIKVQKITASSSENEFRAPEKLLDNNYATRWAADPDAKGGWIQIDLGKSQGIARQILRPEYAWKNYAFKVESSDDAVTWKIMVDYTHQPLKGSPLIIEQKVNCRYLRMTFADSTQGKDISFWEWSFLKSE